MEFPLLNKDMLREHDLRIDKVRTAMQRNDMDAVLAASTVNIFYLTGGVCRGYYYIPADKDPLFFMIPPATPGNDGETTVRKPEQIAELLSERGYQLPRRLGLEFDDLYYSEVERLKKTFCGSETANGSIVMREARMIKTDYEISKMREDGVKQSAAYSKVSSCYREGMTDIELQIELERVLRREGCLGYLRVAGSAMEINLGSLLAGDNADEPSPYDFSMGGAGADPSLPVGASGFTMLPGMAVMVDMNGGFNGYQTDMTRCWCVERIEDIALKANDCSREILRDLEKFGRPGAEIGEMYRRAAAIADKHGLTDHFMGHRHKVKFIGHGVGIELNEGPVIMERNKSSLKAGMTLAIEPKFVFPHIGALGVENTYAVTEEGLVSLTPYTEELQIL